VTPVSSGLKTKVMDNYVVAANECLQTTVMIRGIPKNYDQEMLLAEVESEGFPVNFLYLPPGKTKNNRSYGFVNFETEEAAAAFLRCFEGHHWRMGAKIASVGYATLQGYEQNLEFFSNQEVAKGVAKRSPWVKQY
jgi:RNA recognition motif-containing protein